MYQPAWLVDAKSVAPKKLEFTVDEDFPTPGEAALGCTLEDMATAERALSKPLSIPAKSRFLPGKFVHAQFDGGSGEGLGTGGFVIIGGNGEEIIRIGTYYGSGQTNNEAEMFAARDCIAILAKLSKKMPQLQLPIRVFGDSQLITRFLTRQYKNPTKHTMYWAPHEIWELEKHLKGPIAYRNIPRELNMVVDNMCH